MLSTFSMFCFVSESIPLIFSCKDSSTFLTPMADTALSSADTPASLKFSTAFLAQSVILSRRSSRTSRA